MFEALSSTTVCILSEKAALNKAPGPMGVYFTMGAKWIL
jgi:hypothetical protein